MKGLMSWVRLHPYNIAQKVQIVVEHFRETIAPLLEGKGKAMVVVGSRIEAVRWCSNATIEAEKDPATGHWRIPGHEYERLRRGRKPRAP